MAHTTILMEQCIMANGRMINVMDSVRRHGLTVQCMRDNINVVRRMVEVNLDGKMDRAMRVNLRTTTFQVLNLLSILKIRLRNLHMDRW